jgi:hypothetical protein
MAATATSTWPPTRYHAGAALCPHKHAVANILAAAWKTEHHGWTRWYVVDCPLWPAGGRACDMTCIAQVPDPGDESDLRSA